MTKKHWLIFSISAGLNALLLIAAFHFADFTPARKAFAEWISPGSTKAGKVVCPCGDLPCENCSCNQHPKPLGNNLKNGVMRPTGQIGDK